MRQLPAPDGETIYEHIMQEMEEAMEDAAEEERMRSRRIVPSDGRGVERGVDGTMGAVGGNPEAAISILQATGTCGFVLNAGLRVFE